MRMRSKYMSIDYKTTSKRRSMFFLIQNPFFTNFTDLQVLQKSLRTKIIHGKYIPQSTPDLPPANSKPNITAVTNRSNETYCICSLTTSPWADKPTLSAVRSDRNAAIPSASGPSPKRQGVLSRGTPRSSAWRPNHKRNLKDKERPGCYAVDDVGGEESASYRQSNVSARSFSVLLAGWSLLLVARIVIRGLEIALSLCMRQCLCIPSIYMKLHSWRFSPAAVRLLIINAERHFRRNYWRHEDESKLL